MAHFLEALDLALDSPALDILVLIIACADDEVVSIANLKYFEDNILQGI